MLAGSECFLAAPVGDVTRNRQQLHDRSVQIEDRRDDDVQPFRRAERRLQRALKSSPIPTSRPHQRFFRVATRVALPEFRELHLLHFAEAAELEQAHAFGVDVEHTTEQVEQQEAVAAAFDDARADFLGLDERFLVPSSLGDVRIGPDHSDRGSVRISGDAPSRQEPADAPITVKHPVLDFVESRFASNVRVGACHHGRNVVWMHEPAPIVEVVADLRVGVAEQLLEEGVDVDLASEQVPVPHADAPGGGSAPVLLVAIHGWTGSLTWTRLRRQPRPSTPRRRTASPGSGHGASSSARGREGRRPR